jgi:hypothetical protein
MRYVALLAGQGDAALRMLYCLLGWTAVGGWDAVHAPLQCNSTRTQWNE